MKALRLLARWAIDHVPLGRFAPAVFGFAVGATPKERK